MVLILSCPAVSHWENGERNKRFWLIIIRIKNGGEYLLKYKNENSHERIIKEEKKGKKEKGKGRGRGREREREREKEREREREREKEKGKGKGIMILLLMIFIMIL